MQSSNFSVVHLIYGRTQNHNGGTKISGLLKTLTLYWFSIVKRKVCRGLDTWKSRHRYILGVWVQSWVSENISFVATWKWWNVFPSVGGSPPLPPSARSFVLENAIHTCSSALCSLGLGNAAHLFSLPVALNQALLPQLSSSLGLVQLAGSEHTLQLSTGGTPHNTHVCLGLCFILNSYYYWGIF